MVLEEEKDFICRLKNRDNEAYIRLYDLYFSRLYRLAVHLVYGEEEAKDIVQQLFVDLFEKPVRLEVVRHLGAWLCMAVRNRCLNYLYVQDIEDKRKMLYLEAINEADAPEWLADEELIKRIRTTISGLPEKYRRICELRFYKCMKYAEIAEQLAVSENVAKVQVHRLIQKIKDNISPNDGAALELLVFFMNF